MMDKSPDRFGSVSISKYIRAGCSDCQDLCEVSELKASSPASTGGSARIVRRS